MLRRQQGRSTNDVFQEFDGQVLELRIRFEVLQMLTWGVVICSKGFLKTIRHTWECFVTQCLSTLRTLKVDTLLVMEHFLFAASRKFSPFRFGGPWSGGFPDPAVATANATAAEAELDLLKKWGLHSLPDNEQSIQFRICTRCEKFIMHGRTCPKLIK